MKNDRITYITKLIIMHMGVQMPKMHCILAFGVDDRIMLWQLTQAALMTQIINTSDSLNTSIHRGHIHGPADCGYQVDCDSRNCLETYSASADPSAAFWKFHDMICVRQLVSVSNIVTSWCIGVIFCLQPLPDIAWASILPSPILRQIA